MRSALKWAPWAALAAAVLLPACDNHNSSSSGIGTPVGLSTIATSSGTFLNVSGTWIVQVDHQCPVDPQSSMAIPMAITQTTGTITGATFSQNGQQNGFTYYYNNTGGGSECLFLGGGASPQFASGSIDTSGNLVLNFNNPSAYNQGSNSTFTVNAVVTQDGRMNGHWSQSAVGSHRAYAAFFGGTHQ